MRQIGNHIAAWMGMGVGAGVLICASCPAQADWYVSLHQESYSTTLNGVGDSKQYDSGLLHQLSVSNTQTSSYSTADGNGSMSASTNTFATTRLGNLHGSAFTTADGEGLIAGSEVFVNMGFRDEFTAFGPTQGDGYIHLPYAFTLNDTISSSGAVTAQSNASARFKIYGLFDITDSGASPYNGPRTISGEVVLAPGQTFSVEGFLQLHPFVNSTGGPASESVEANNSFDFYLDKDPISGGSYTSRSGATYFSTAVVPEPGSIALLLSIGVSGGVFALRCRARK